MQMGYVNSMPEQLFVLRQGRIIMHRILRVQAQRLTAAGADYLDKAAVQHPDIVPARWYHTINLNILDVKAPAHCVLSQLGQASSRYALLDYEATACALGLDPYPEDHYGAVVELGFHAVPGEWELDEYRELTVAWKWLILGRRARDPQWTFAKVAS